ncbi:type II toxin-antitoxin system HicA family toxin [Aneurinibacillus thermoaerophilus]|uniref:HicA toxin of toxin-antitoxin n=1 Tax=Aneurinibacillus thermoaerophilus TaxID=143495 RepID=A0A1G8DXC3_ANETH|nr:MULTISPECIES: type II toxin-antitoxin system HicA family toxin [Aneurinibacillus]AMA73441.1 hypothetical protein ACH33_11630 [Aneurinibacillus sp. XH2]MED0676739.1 type II toxin-antitoxin system HicA family toxin [Aneurinibacillus thermoaerophilus]MED0680621.1 type II toxin-antitoxin system HicA family toxin [Aneurinibacillus thermoaerophilus]MED0757070.1 type II toxin-antitoxin system HicA family toxin [Aneurinibacillus thermoaerophilus]MED0760435.1 type II toxin-antitoxin system HicA fami
MARIDKILEKMKNRPNGIWFEEIAIVLEYYGYIQVRSKGSHHHFRNQAGDVITIPKQNPVKAVYVKNVLKRMGE